MARKSAIVKNERRLAFAQRFHEKRQQLRQRGIDPSLTEEERHEARTALNKMPRDTSLCRVRNRCTLTGRCRGFLRKFGISRLCFREMANKGLIPGVTKASW